MRCAEKHFHILPHNPALMPDFFCLSLGPSGKAIILLWIDLSKSVCSIDQKNPFAPDGLDQKVVLYCADINAGFFRAFCSVDGIIIAGGREVPFLNILEKPPSYR